MEVLLTGTVEISFDTNGGSRPPEMQSTDNGKKVGRPEDPVREDHVYDRNEDRISKTIYN